ncbi:MAG: LuxR C-terminal-related transcriptional regulator [Gemmatimonadaceae bacterium]|nr:LuxR C-terminal-related transcriptional regulator [Gemmatimonadaceae bacterium]
MLELVHSGRDSLICRPEMAWSAAQLEHFAKWKLDDEGTRRTTQMGIEIASVRSVGGTDLGAFAEDPMVRQWYKPNGVHDAIAYVLHWPEDKALAMIELHGRTLGTPRLSTEGEEILQLLLPSLRAGMRMIQSLGKHREALASKLDSLGVALCVCARDGTVVHRSPLVAELLSNDPQANTVMQGVRRVAQTVAPQRNGMPTDRVFVAPVAQEIVQTAHGRYRLSAALAADPMRFGASDVMVTVGAMAQPALTPAVLATRFRMSKREAEVAVLLAQGARNAPIAKALSLSPHTVRRHTERVLAKLDVVNRSEAAAKLRV